MARQTSLILFLLLLTISGNAQNKPFALIELFTSEGCSSCPKADEVVSQLKDDYKGKVFVLGFHVDYWNRLGWKDIYSSKDYSNRQQAYAAALKLESVYTPQVIVNGRQELVGSDKTKLYTLTAQALKNKAASSITLSARHTGANKVLVSYTLPNTTNENLNIALVQSNASSDVKKGENAGRKLRHVNIVRAFKTIDITKSSGELSLELPANLSYRDCTVIAFIQKSNMEIVAASESAIE